jgi:hypothetical protein
MLTYEHLEFFDSLFDYEIMIFDGLLGVVHPLQELLMLHLPLLLHVCDLDAKLVKYRVRAPLIVHGFF